MFSISFRKHHDEKKENNLLTLIIKMYILFARVITTSTARASSFLGMFSNGHVTRCNFSCNLQRNKSCVASCKKKFTCNTPLFNCNCCVASCKISRTQRWETSCLRVTFPQQLAIQFCQNGPIRAHPSLA